MGEIIEFLTEPQTLLSILASIAVFATIITLSMPLLREDELETRMNAVAIERDKIRALDRARLAEQEKQRHLKQSDESFSRKLVENLNLKKAFADEATYTSLLMAGYRTSSHINILLAARVGLPIIFAVIAVIYLFIISPAERSFFMNFAVILFAASGGFYLPVIIVKNKISKRQTLIKRAWPDALDLLLICVESGMSLEAALKKVFTEIGIQSSDLAEELALVTAELSYLQERRQAYENLAKRTGLESIKAVTMALIQAERYGTPLSTALRAMSQESRDMRMAEVEKKAAALPPKLTVPMILFFLPVLFAVILGPAIMRITGI